MKHIYFHISSRKTLVPFALYNLGFIVFFSHSCSFFLSFILCLVAFFLSLCFSKTLCILHSLLQGTQKLKYSNVALSAVVQKGFLLISRKKIQTVRGVLRVWVMTASVMTFPRVTMHTCFLLKPFRRSTN